VACFWPVLMPVLVVVWWLGGEMVGVGFGGVFVLCLKLDCTSKQVGRVWYKGLVASEFL
jgi:hypothetical protein